MSLFYLAFCFTVQNKSVYIDWILIVVDYSNSNYLYLYTNTLTIYGQEKFFTLQRLENYQK